MKKIIIVILGVLLVAMSSEAQKIYNNTVPLGNTWYKIKTRGRFLCKITTSGAFAEHEQISYLISGNYDTAEVTVLSEFNYNHQYVDIQYGYVGDAHNRYLAIKSIPITSGISVNGISIFDVSDDKRIIELEEVVGAVTEISPSNKLFIDEVFSKVGVGTVKPTAKFSVEGGDIYVGSEDNSNGRRRQIRVYGYDNNAQFYGSLHSNYDNLIRTFDISTNSTTQQLKIDASSNPASKILLLPGSLSGVGIGTTTPDAKLDVAGNIKAQEIEVTLARMEDLNLKGTLAANTITVKANGNTADFVFSDTYQLKDLTEVENFIKTNKHLPDIPSAEAMEAQGVNLAEMNKLLLQKVEELTLYSIDLEKKNKKGKEEREKLEERLAKIEVLLSEKTQSK